MAKDLLPEGKPPKSVVSMPTNRITVAFPFSNIKTIEPSDQLRELANIVAELTEHVAKLRPSPETDALVQRAHAAVAKL